MAMDPGKIDLVTSLRLSSRETPDRTAFVFLNSRLEETELLSYDALDRRARALGALLQDRTTPGDRVLLVHPPGLEFVAALFACFYAGCVAVPVPAPRPARRVNPALAIRRDDQSLDRLINIIDNCRPAMLLTVTSLTDILAEFVQTFPCLTTDTVDDSFSDGWIDYVPRTNDIAFLQYTSGSTGFPKGVKVNHGNLLANLSTLHESFGHVRDNYSLTWLPHYHDMGLIATIIYPASQGTSCCMMAPTTFSQSPIRWLQAISRYRAASSGAPNFAYDLCVRRTTPAERAELDLSCWGMAFNGAEPVRAATLERFVDAFAPQGFRRSSFLPCYGLAEATLIASGRRRQHGPLTLRANAAALAAGILQPDALAAGDSPDTITLTSSGSGLTGHRLAIVDPQTGHPLPPGRVGEIWLTGPSVSAGYWEHPDSPETFEAVLASGGPERFLRTGDLGALWEGELFVSGRAKDLIIIDGQNFHPEDIENTVERTHPDVRPGRSAVFSVEVKGSERLVIAIERPRKDTTSPETIFAVIRNEVARYHALPVYQMVFLNEGELPRTTSGKVRRHRCRERYCSGAYSVTVS